MFYVYYVQLHTRITDITFQFLDYGLFFSTKIRR